MCTDFNMYTPTYHVQQYHKVIHAPCTYNHYASLLYRANNLRALLSCHVSKSTALSLRSSTITCCVQFDFVSHIDITCTFHSMRYTMLMFGTPPPRTNTLRAPLTKPLCNNISPHCARTNQTPLCSTNTMHTMCTIIMCVHTAHTILCICTPRNAKFSACNYTSTFFCKVPKFSVCTHTPKFFHAVLKFNARTCTLTFFRVAPKFRVRTHTPKSFYAVPNFFTCH
jgi:hypothetical protein